MASQLDLTSIRARFPALSAREGGRLVSYLDGPGGSQVPREVLDAMRGYLERDNANLGGAFRASRASDDVIEAGRGAIADFVGGQPEEIAFGANMTTLNFLLAHAVTRTFSPGDEIVTTWLDHDANVSPWLELAHDLGLKVSFVEIADDTTLDYDDLEHKLTDRTRAVAFTLASNAVGTLTDARRIADLAHRAGALAWIDAVHYAPHAPIDVGEVQADVLLCSPYKYYGPHLGLATVRADLAAEWRSYKVRPATHPFETGTLAHELLAGFVAAVEHIESVGWRAIQAHERSLGQQFLDGLPDRCTLYGLQTMEGRVPTFAFNVDGRSARSVAEHLGARDIAVWDGDYYAVEVMQRLGLIDGGAVRAGFVHYNTPAEVDRLLAALDEL